MSNNTTIGLISDNGHPVISLTIIAPMMVSCVIAIIANMFVCYLILTVHALKSPTNVFVFSLCICDIMFAGVLLPVHCFYQSSLLYSFLVIINVLIYIANITAVTYERLYSITKPLKYRQFMTERRAINITIACWIIPLCYCLLPLIWQSDTTTLPHKIYLIGTLTIFLLAPMVFIFFVYFKVCLEIKYILDYEKRFKLSKQKTKKIKNPKIDDDDDMQKSCCKNFFSGTSNSSNEIKLKDRNENFSTRSAISSCEVRLEEQEFLAIFKKKNHISFLDNASISSSVIESDSESVDNQIESSQRKRQKSSFHRNSNRKRRSIIPQNIKIKSNLAKMKNKMADLKASFAFGIVAFTYLFTWLPVAIMTFFIAIDKPQYITESMAVFSVFAIAVNALTDPFLYAILLRPFRKTIQGLIKKFSTRYV